VIASNEGARRAPWLIATVFLFAQSVCAAASDSGSVTVSPAERGKYLATAGNCTACHTTSGGALLAGGVAFKTPFGTIYSTNITPDPQTGIGKWTEKQFVQALCEGVRADGAHLYPVFPYTSFTKITDGDATALYLYLRSVPPVSAETPENDMSFPYNQRWLMSLWKALYFEEGTYKPDASKSAEWNRGAYLVEGLGHCSACHSPRNFLGAEDANLALTGGVYTDKVATDALREWSAPNLTSAANGLGTWSVADLAAYLKTGKNAHAVTFGPMNEVILNSTQHLTDADVRAMATYLKSLPAKEGDVGTQAQDDVLSAGSTLYDVHCGTCHQPTGLGAEDSGPRLAGSLIVQAPDPASLINVIIYGPQLPERAPPTDHWQPMEAYGEKLSDEEIAALASYVRSAWHNKAGAVTAAQVGKQR
jgi:mono/diheme cytochrome c family protein